MAENSLELGEWWTQEKKDLLEGVFAGQQSLTKLAGALGIPYHTARKYVRDDEFKTALAALRNKLAEELEGIPFIRKESRLIALSKHAEDALHEWEDHRYLIEERPVLNGVMTQERLNRDASDIFRASLADIAAELGDRKTTVAFGGVDGAPTLIVNQVNITEDMMARYLKVGQTEDANPLIEAARLVEADGGDDL